MTIDPSSCKPDEAYVVTLRSGATSIAMRLVGLNRRTPWAIPNGGNFVWLGDDEVAVLHRLVPEPEEKVLDVPMQPWDTLRTAAELVESASGAAPTVGLLMRLADRLEAEHRAAHEKAEQAAAWEALIEKATDAYNAAAEAQASRAPLGSRDTAPWRDGIRAVIDTVLAEAVTA